MTTKPIIEELRERFREIVAEHHLEHEEVHVTIGTLTVKQAIGDPARRDYPLIEGKEVMIEAEVNGGFGQAFTDRPHEFTGSLTDIVQSDLTVTDNRAVFMATLNATLASLKQVSGVRHCHDEEPENCAKEIAAFLKSSGDINRVGLIGLQPAILDHLAQAFGGDNVWCTDLNPQNVGKKKYGAEIWDGRTDTERLIDRADVILATSSTIVNGTYDSIREKTEARGKRLIIFGVTGAAAAALLGIERLCYQPH